MSSYGLRSRIEAKSQDKAVKGKASIKTLIKVATSREN